MTERERRFQRVIKILEASRFPVSLRDLDRRLGRKLSGAEVVSLTYYEPRIFEDRRGALGINPWIPKPNTYFLPETRRGKDRKEAAEITEDNDGLSQ
jgi:hypothetical protein